MGLLDQLAGQFLRQLTGGRREQSGLLDMIFSLVQNYPGGLAGLVQQFTQAGYADQAKSWVGTGENLPISPEQIISALGARKVNSMAQEFNVNQQTAASGLAGLLPIIVDRLTPKGQVTQGDELSSLLSGLQKEL
ncbi:MAG TPA: YidB family protein [Syntrophobacteria bacterium]|nr:YidB family protein [Syntrophobacteria bacterium]